MFILRWWLNGAVGPGEAWGPMSRRDGRGVAELLMAQ